jgi:GH24 family phage-related lysozyme (muramidase)
MSDDLSPRRRSLRAIALSAAGAAAFLLAAFGVGAVTPSAAAPTTRCAAAEQRDCTIQGEVHGSSTDGGVVVSWSGGLVLSQRFVDPVTKGPMTTPTFVPAAGSSINWNVTGHSGDCAFAGAGTITSADLTGSLEVSRPESGKWLYNLSIGPRPSRAYGDNVMPFQETCTNSTTTRDAGSGLTMAYNSYTTGQSHANVVTDGMTLSGSIVTPYNQIWSWNLKGEIFTQHVSEHGVTLIKRLEGLGLPGKPGWAYEDSVHKCTIGYGHLLLPEGRCGKRAKLHWTKAKADQVLRSDLDKMMEPYVRKASLRLGFNQCEYDSLLSFAYNVAHGKGGESQSWMKLMKGLTPTGDWRQAIEKRLPGFVNAIDSKTHKLVKLKGLVWRRGQELKMFRREACPCNGVAH